jgi:hypothetical protein
MSDFKLNKFEIFFMQIILGMFLTTVSFYVESFMGPDILTAGIPMGMWIVCLSPVTFLFLCLLEYLIQSGRLAEKHR